MPISVVDTPREGFLPDWVDPVHESDLIERRRAIHMTPEVGWCEFLSTARAAEVLSGLGFEVKVGREILQSDYVRGRDPEEAEYAELYAKDQGVPRHLLDRMEGLTGCVAVFDTKRPGKTICIRAELDALYINEPEDPEHLPTRENFHSMRPGVMHARPFFWNSGASSPPTRSASPGRSSSSSSPPKKVRAAPTLSFVRASLTTSTRSSARTSGSISRPEPSIRRRASSSARKRSTLNSSAVPRTLACIRRPAATL